MYSNIQDDLLDLPTDGKGDGPDIDDDDEDEDDLVNGIMRSAKSVAPSPPCLRVGGWQVEYRPNDNSNNVFDGIIRVDYAKGISFASGDLFQRKLVLAGLEGAQSKPKVEPPVKPQSVAVPQYIFIPKPQNGVPVLPLSQYSHHLPSFQLKSGSTDNRTVEMKFSLRKYSAPPENQGGEGTWSKDVPVSTILTQSKAGEDFPSPTDYYQGDVKNATGQVIATIKMGWVSKYYRKVSLEIATVAGAKPPLDNGSGLTWRSVFEPAGVDINVIVDTPNVPEPTGGTWTPADLRAAMLRCRGKVDLDTEARFYLLVVKKIQGKAMERGVMFDFGTTDSKKTREGAAVATEWEIPKTGWGSVGGQKWGNRAALLFRSAVHEIGHAMNLKHKPGTQTFTDSSDRIAEDGERLAVKFPDNINWSFHDKDIGRIRHMPEISFRPGGRPFGSTQLPGAAPRS